jgi:hypothetical protein
MADKLKAVKITFKELEHIVEKKGGNKTTLLFILFLKQH